MGGGKVTNMDKVYYKIGEVAEILEVEQYTLRYLEHTLRLKIKRDERGDRLYSEANLDTLRLILKLKNEKGLNTTAIRMALNNLEEIPESGVPAPAGGISNDIVELGISLRRIVEQNDELLSQNKILNQKIESLEMKINQKDALREEKFDELIRLWRKEQDDRNKLEKQK